MKQTKSSASPPGSILSTEREVTLETDDVWHERVLDLADCILHLADEHRGDNTMTRAGLLGALCHPELHETTRMHFEIGLLPDFDEEDFQAALQHCINCQRLEVDGAGVYRYRMGKPKE